MKKVQHDKYKVYQLDEQVILKPEDIKTMTLNFFFKNNMKMSVEQYFSLEINKLYKRNIYEFELIIAKNYYKHLLKLCDILDAYILNISYNNNINVVNYNEIIESFNLDNEMFLPEPIRWIPIIKIIINNINNVDMEMEI